jgi:hypothetical protein
MKTSVYLSIFVLLLITSQYYASKLKNKTKNQVKVNNKIKSKDNLQNKVKVENQSQCKCK